MLPKKVTDHVIAKISGVKPTDSRIEAAEKAIATMKLAGLSTKAAERMLAAAKARGVK